MIELEKTLEIKFESVNFLEEQVTDWIWEALYENFDELPKNSKVKIRLEFIPND